MYLDRQALSSSENRRALAERGDVLNQQVPTNKGRDRTRRVCDERIVLAGCFFFVEDTIEGVGGEMVEIFPGGRERAYCLADIVRGETGARTFLQGAEIPVAP